MNLYGLNQNDGVNGWDAFGLSPTFSINNGDCTINAVIRWRFIGEDNPLLDHPTFKWDKGFHSSVEWKSKAERIIEDYFNRVPLRCVKTFGGCPCEKTGGFKLKVDVQWVLEGGDPVRVALGDRLRSEFKNGELFLDLYDLIEEMRELNGIAYTQTTILHETAHYFGLDHPGAPGASDEYTKDPDSLLGLGQVLREKDFEKAFCARLAGGYKARSE